MCIRDSHQAHDLVKIDFQKKSLFPEKEKMAAAPRTRFAGRVAAALTKMRSVKKPALGRCKRRRAGFFIAGRGGTAVAPARN